MTGGAIQEQLRHFAGRLLEQSGGVVEWNSPDEPGVAMVPAEVAALLHAPSESLALSTEPGGGGLLVSLSSDFLDLAGRVLEHVVPRDASFRLSQRYLKKGNLEEAVARTYHWPNARVKMQGAGAATIEYHTWSFHAALRSEDAWEGALSLTINSQSGAEIGFPDPLELFDLEDAPRSQAASPDTFDQAAGRVLRRMMNEAATFLARLDARRQRDQKRLRDYYGALRKEAGAVNKRTKHPPTTEETADKQRAVELELRRKLLELDQRYRIEATVRPVAVVRTQVPALAIELSVQRKQAKRIHFVYWNSLLKQFEPLSCSVCGGGTFSPDFTNDTVLPLCPRCSESGGQLSPPRAK